MGYREEIEEELDKHILASYHGWKDVREAERKVLELQEAVREHDLAMQRLRMALFTLNGEYHKSYGDANVANNERKAELLAEEKN